MSMATTRSGGVRRVAAAVTAAVGVHAGSARLRAAAAVTLPLPVTCRRLAAAAAVGATRHVHMAAAAAAAAAGALPPMPPVPPLPPLTPPRAPRTTYDGELDDPAAPMTPATVVVSPRWLAAHAREVTLVDASWYMPAAARDVAREHAAWRLPRAAWWDIDAVADTTTGLPHMLPSADAFSVAAAGRGIRHAVPVVVYDSAGVFSAARLWWTLRAYGHPMVAVLNGGMPRWLADGERLASADADDAPPPPVPPEAWSLVPGAVASLAEVRAAVATRHACGAPPPDAPLIVDARPAPRFLGDAPEPRPGLARGHMPGAVNVPFSTLLHAVPAAGYSVLASPAAAAATLAAAGVDPRRPGRLVASCGSGITACVIALAAAHAGRAADATAVYDGSWAEYGGVRDAPVVTGPG